MAMLLTSSKRTRAFAKQRQKTNVLMLLLATVFASTSLGATCYDKSRPPMPLVSSNGSGDTDYLALAGCRATDLMYAGGYTMSPDLLWGKTPPLPILTLIDESQFVYGYRRSFEVPDGDF